MTALDDGLNTSAPLLAEPTVKADWPDLPPEYEANTKQDSIQQLGQQIGPQGLQVTQSFDDGLPDSVTTTSGNDASGTLSAELVGRPGLTVKEGSVSWVGTFNLTGYGTYITPASWGTTMQFMDYHVVAITVDSDTNINETTVPYGQPGAWEILGDIPDGGYRTVVFGRQHFPSAVLPVFTVGKNVNWTMISGVVHPGSTLGGAIVPVTPGRVEQGAETFNVTPHIAPPVVVSTRGWVLAVFAAPVGNGPWIPASGTTTLVSYNGFTSAVQMSLSAEIKSPTTTRVTASTTTATDTVMAIAIPFMIRERPMLDAPAYFSPFNTLSPVVGWARDTAPVTASINVVTPSGPVSTQIFKGQMADIPVSNRSASLEAVSTARLKLDKSFTVPTLNGEREGASTDWLASFLMSQGGQYIGPAPTRNTRLWAPLHGSLHPHMDGPLSYPTSSYYDSTRSPMGPYAQRPAVVPGLFGPAMYANSSDALVQHIALAADPTWQTNPPGIDNPLTYDILSKKNGRGRLSFYIRADANTAVPAALGGADPYLFRFTLYNRNAAGSGENYIQFKIRGDRQYDHTLGNTASAVGGLTLPTDGAWHFIGFAWDYVAATTMGKRNGTSWSTNSHSSTLAELPSSTADWYARGLYTNCFIESRLPISDIDVSFGPEVYTGVGSTTWEAWRGPTTYLDPPTRNATFRPTYIPLAAIAEPTPVQGWAKLQEVAQSTLCSMRLNESDNMEFVTPGYFGETAQMTVSIANIFDTSINAADLEIVADASKTRNVVTSAFQEVRVDSSRTSVLEITSVVTIPRGESYMTFALDTQVAEIHGGGLWQSTSPDLQLLTANQIDGTATIQNEHVFTVNTFADGATNGRRFSSAVKARIVNWDNSSVTIRFRNNFFARMFLANNGSQIPTLRILGYPIRQTDAYTTVRDAGSIGLRKERGLNAELPWIQDRDSAESVTTALVGQIARPRPQISVTVMGDPRRRPGMLTRLVDATGTAVSGNWRIMACKHRQVGAMYVNDLELIGVPDSAVWDVSYWDEAVWSA